MRKAWVWDPKKRKLVPKETRHKAGLLIYGDLKPYTAIAGDMAGKEISSRSKHREFLKRNGFEEVGNEKKYMDTYRERFLKDQERKSAAKLTEALSRTLDQYGI